MSSALRPLRSVLVANRGEIAVRVMCTARAMGLRAIAVYSEADRHAMHVRRADEAYSIGPAPARASYLSIDAILAVARASGADAIHPGYGFLSENAEFAEACVAAGFVFVGPPAAAIRAMGSKSGAKALMEQAGVPLVPGYHGEDQTDAALAAAAAEIGFPVLIKASAGGGGRGMRVARHPDELVEALASARREAAGAFGDDRLLLERYLEGARHVEVQVFADAHGNVVHMFERDCSLQRRHQKVIEEAPAPGLDAAQRRAMGAAAVRVAQTVGYVGAGTVEFIVVGDDFHFMEMNTRLQVEHPVTEAVTGIDLVEWQLRVARGEPLPLAQDGISATGHAIEARLYAEDPLRDFLPQTGVLRHLRLPDDRPGVRVDSGVEAGDTVSPHYDAMLAKVIAHGADRAEALARLAAALDATEVVGPGTNRRFLAALASHPAFAAGAFDTGFIAKHRDDLLALPPSSPSAVVALAAAVTLDAMERRDDPADPWSPWAGHGAWQPNLPSRLELRLASGDTSHDVVLHAGKQPWQVEVSGEGFEIELGPRSGSRIEARIDDVTLPVGVVVEGQRLSLLVAGDEHGFELVDRCAAPRSVLSGGGHLLAPMPGTVTAVAVRAGDRVTRGMALVVVEAMKMEHTVTAPDDGAVAAVHCAVGDLVDEGAELVVLEAAS